MSKENPMREVRLDKITINMGAGDSGPKLEKSKKMLENITGKSPVVTRTQKRSTFGVGKFKPIGTKITLRGDKALELLKKLLQSNDNIISPKVFDKQGNFSFGVAEYINIPGIKYDPDVGILGMDVAVTLTRPGYRVKNRRMSSRSIGKSHRITPEDAMGFARNVLEVTVGEKED